MTIKEKVKRYITERNARKGGAESGSGKAATPTTPAVEVLGREDMGAPGLNAGQDAVDN